MNEHIATLAKQHLLPVRYSRYGETIEGDYYEFEPEELQNFLEFLTLEIVDEFMHQLWKHGIDEANNPAFYKALEKCLESFGICHKKNHTQLNLI